MNAGRDGSSAVVVGLGNIGSQLVPLLAQSRRFDTLILVDPDIYDDSNRWTQNIAAADVGRPKVDVQAGRVRVIDPSLRVEAIRAAVEDVPLARLRASVLLSGPDSRRARQHVNRIVWRLGINCWIDGGIDPASRFTRVSLFVPTPETPCLECGWGPDDYRILGEHLSCSDPSAEPHKGFTAATRGSSALGALVAARMAILCDDVAPIGSPAAGASIQITLAVREHRLLTTTHRVNPACRFDHVRLDSGSPPTIGVRTPLGELAGSTVLDAALVRGRMAERDAPLRLSVDGCLFGRRFACPDCGSTTERLSLVRPHAGARLRCACGRPPLAGAFDSSSCIDLDRLSVDDSRRSLGDLGLEPGDLLSLAQQGGADAVIEVADRAVV